LVKDLGITRDFMEHSHFETDLPALLRGYLSDALTLVEPDADHTECIRGWEKRAGVELKKSEHAGRIPDEDFGHLLAGLNI
jgi:hypothetical protein